MKTNLLRFLIFIPSLTGFGGEGPIAGVAHFPINKTNPGCVGATLYWSISSVALDARLRHFSATAVLPSEFDCQKQRVHLVETYPDGIELAYTGERHEKDGVRTERYQCGWRNGGHDGPVPRYCSREVKYHAVREVIRIPFDGLELVSRADSQTP